MVEKQNTKSTIKHNSMDESEIEQVKLKMDREYERVFLNRMEELKIIKRPKAVKAKPEFMNNSNIANNDEHTVRTNFYEQLINQKVRFRLGHICNIAGCISVQKTDFGG